MSFIFLQAENGDLFKVHLQKVSIDSHLIRNYFSDQTLPEGTIFPVPLVSSKVLSFISSKAGWDTLDDDLYSEVDLAFFSNYQLDTNDISKEDIFNALSFLCCDKLLTLVTIKTFAKFPFDKIKDLSAMTNRLLRSKNFYKSFNYILTKFLAPDHKSTGAYFIDKLCRTRYKYNPIARNHEIFKAYKAHVLQHDLQSINNIIKWMITLRIPNEEIIDFFEEHSVYFLDIQSISAFLNSCASVGNVFLLKYFIDKCDSQNINLSVLILYACSFYSFNDEFKNYIKRYHEKFFDAQINKGGIQYVLYHLLLWGRHIHLKFIINNVINCDPQRLMDDFAFIGRGIFIGSYYSEDQTTIHLYRSVITRLLNDEQNGEYII